MSFHISGPYCTQGTPHGDQQGRQGHDLVLLFSHCRPQETFRKRQHRVRAQRLLPLRSAQTADASRGLEPLNPSHPDSRGRGRGPEVGSDDVGQQMGRLLRQVRFWLRAERREHRRRLQRSHQTASSHRRIVSLKY
jgi:hypothetical protein